MSDRDRILDQALGPAVWARQAVLAAHLVRAVPGRGRGGAVPGAAAAARRVLGRWRQQLEDRRAVRGRAACDAGGALPPAAPRR
ncbi:MAG: hypothetical protein WDO24_19985 [Pseudomonadota bacterium]